MMGDVMKCPSCDGAAVGQHCGGPRCSWVRCLVCNAAWDPKRRNYFRRVGENEYVGGPY